MKAMRKLRGTIVKTYARRDFLKTAAVGTAAIAVLPSLTGLAGVAGADGDDNKTRQFSFVAQTRKGTSADRVLLDGGSFFNEEEARGEGGSTHFLEGTGTPAPPPTIVAFGRWKVKKLVSFTPSATSGAHLGGILNFTVDLRTSTRLRIRGVAMKVVCRFPAPISADSEGVTLSGPVTFDNPIAGSQTLFSERRPD